MAEVLDRCYDAGLHMQWEQLAGEVQILQELAERHADDHVAAHARFYALVPRLMDPGDPTAEHELEDLSRIYEELKDHVFHSRMVANRGRLYAMSGEHEPARELLLQALRISETHQDPTGVFRVANYLMLLPDKAENAGQLVKDLLKSASTLGAMGDERTQVQILAHTCFFASNEASDQKTAIWAGERAIELAQRIQAPDLECEAYDSLGGAYWTLGDAGRSAEYHLKAVALAEHAASPQIHAQTLMNAAYPFIQLEDFEKVAALNRKSIDVLVGRESDPMARHMTAWAEFGLAHALLNLGELDEPIERTTRAIGLLEGSSVDPHGLGYAFFRRGEVRVAQGDLDAALKDFQKSLEYRLKKGANLEISESQCEIGKLLAARGEVEEALEMLNVALRTAEESNNRAVVSTTLKALAEVYRDVREYERAYDHLQRHVEVRSEIMSQAATRRASAAEIWHEQELKERERAATEAILNHVLPLPISERLKEGEKQIADPAANVTVLFADIVNFTPLVAELSAEDLVQILSQVFSHFDAICETHGLEKVKTIGDAYMAVAGAPDPCTDPATRCVKAAREMVKPFVISASALSGSSEDLPLTFRLGIHSGSAVAGVIGEQRIAYDLWGDAVNTAARMESHGQAGKIHISDAVLSALRQEGSVETFSVTERGAIDVKGKGQMHTYFVE